jgi:DNA-binding NarL/FixJ family response regulator
MLDSLRPGSADVLLLDLGLPDVNGIDAIPAIRARLPDIQVVVLTAEDSGESLINALSQGAAGYLVKNSSPEDFSSNLCAALHGENVVSQCMIKYLVGNLQTTLQELEQLTLRERETFMLVTAGQSYKQAAGVMGVSINTVRTHIRSVYRKLDVRSRAEASHKTRA